MLWRTAVQVELCGGQSLHPSVGCRFSLHQGPPGGCQEPTPYQRGDLRLLPCALSGSSSSRLSSALSASDDFSRLLVEFPALTRPTFSSATAKHGVEHYITATGPPVHARARRLEPGKLAVAKAEFEALEDLGIVRRSDSP